MTDIYAVFGNPARHSRSPHIHMEFARAAGQDIEYGIEEAPLDGFEPALAAFRQKGGRGANITAPFKLRAYALADRKSPAAVLAGAANCLTFDDDGIRADNFDGIGLVRDIEANLGVRLQGLQVLMLGAGGAARGAALPLLEAGPARLVIANRNADRAAELCASLPDHANLAAIPVDAEAGGFDVVINATSASLTGDCPAMPLNALQNTTLAYDMSYARGLTPFLQKAADAGAGQLADGVGMLVEQAAEAFALWRGIRPDTGPVIRMIATETEAIRPENPARSG